MSNKLWFRNCSFALMVAMTICFVALPLNAWALDNQSLKTALASEKCLFEKNDADMAGISAEYEARNHEPLWISDNNPNPQALRLLAELQRSAAHGLKPEFYNHEELLSLSGSSDPEALACFETGLSLAFSKYANDVANGHIRKDEWPEHTIVQPVFYESNALFAAAKDVDVLSTFLKTLLTTDDRYVRLISKLTEFMRIDARKAWPEVRNLGSSNNPATDPEKVQSLLLFTGDLESKELLRGGNDPEVMRSAIKRFQSRYGLEANGRIDLPTIRAMGDPVTDKISKILINLERRRWQNRDLGADHVYINLADQSVRIVRDGEKEGSAALSQIEGLEKLPTFSGSVEAVRVSENGELVVELASDTSVGFFGGKLKSEFHLSGSPKKHLGAMFGEAAQGVLLENPGDRFVLDQPVDAFVTYLTAWANKDGSISFRPDVFKRDRELAKLLGF